MRARRRRRPARRSLAPRATPPPDRAAPSRPTALARAAHPPYVEKLPVWIFLNKDARTTRPGVGARSDLKGIGVAAVVPQLTSTEIVDVGQMAVKLFKDKCKKVGWTAHLACRLRRPEARARRSRGATLRRSSTYDDGTNALHPRGPSPMR